MEPKQNSDSGQTAAYKPSDRPEQSSDGDTNYSRLSEIQTRQETNETAAALRSVERLSEQIVQAHRKLELALAETARLHRALTERNSAASAAEQRATALAERLLDREQALRDARTESADASVQIGALQSSLADASTNASKTIEGLQTELLETRKIASQTIEALQSQMAEILSSSSWRVTSPLRVAKTLVGRITKR